MTNTEKLIQAGWEKVRSYDECGEALYGSGHRLNGLACVKRGAWRKPGTSESLRCAQHAADLI